MIINNRDNKKTTTTAATKNGNNNSNNKNNKRPNLFNRCPKMLFRQFYWFYEKANIGYKCENASMLI